MIHHVLVIEQLAGHRACHPAPRPGHRRPWPTPRPERTWPLWGESEPLLVRVLAARERTLGPEHPQALATLSDLALDYWDQGRYAEAEPLLKRGSAASTTSSLWPPISRSPNPICSSSTRS